jgi:hypothetical protein
VVNVGLPGVEFSSCLFLITLSCLFRGIFAPGGNCYALSTALWAAKGRRSPPAGNSNVFTRPAARPGRSRRRVVDRRGLRGPGEGGSGEGCPVLIALLVLF